MRNPRHFNHFHKSLFRLYCDMTQGFVRWDADARYELEAVILPGMDQRGMISYYLNEALTLIQAEADKKREAEREGWPSRQPITPLGASILADSQFDAPRPVFPPNSGLDNMGRPTDGPEHMQRSEVEAKLDTILGKDPSDAE